MNLTRPHCRRGEVGGSLAAYVWSLSSGPSAARDTQPADLTRSRRFPLRGLVLLLVLCNSPSRVDAWAWLTENICWFKSRRVSWSCLCAVRHCTGVGSSANKALACLWALFQLTSSHMIREWAATAQGTMAVPDGTELWQVFFKNTISIANLVSAADAVTIDVKKSGTLTTESIFKIKIKSTSLDCGKNPCRQWKTTSTQRGPRGRNQNQGTCKSSWPLYLSTLSNLEL